MHIETLVDFFFLTVKISFRRKSQFYFFFFFSCLSLDSVICILQYLLCVKDLRVVWWWGMLYKIPQKLANASLSLEGNYYEYVLVSVFQMGML